MSLLETAGAPWVTSTTNVVTSASFTPNANNLLVAIACVGNGNNNSSTGIAITDSVGGTWTSLAVQINTFGTMGGVWVKNAGVSPVAQTVTATGSGPSTAGTGLIVRQFAGAAPAASQNGVVVSSGQPSNEPYSATINPGTSGSQVVGTYAQSSFSVILTPNSSTSVYGSFTDSTNGDTESAFEAAGMSRAGTPITLGFTNAGTASAVLVLVEILPSGVNPAGVVQQQSGSVSNDYGLDNIPFTNTAGNFLIAFIGWEFSQFLTNAPIPVANVTDSAGNLWKQIGISSSQGYGSRCAIWCCPNAQAVTWLSVALTGWASATAYTIVEITGMPQNVSIDFSVTNFNDFATTLAVSGTTGSTIDIGFLLLNSVIYNNSVTSGPGAGWTALTVSSSTGADGTGCVNIPYFQTGIAAGTTLSPSFTVGTQAGLSAVLCTISATSAPPPQFTSQSPRVVVEAAFGAMPGDYSQSVDYTWTNEYITWTDLSTRAYGQQDSVNITISRGRQYELSQEEAGELDFKLDNHDGAFTPTNPASPYYSNAINSNMSFELSISSWTAFGGLALSKSSAFAFTGTSSMLGTPNGTVFPGVSSENVAINVNNPYSASAQVYCPAGWASGVQVAITWLTSALGVISTTSGSIIPIPAGVWTQVSLANASPPATAAFCHMVIQIQGSPTGGTLFYFDEAAVVTGPSVVQTGLVRLNTPIRVTAWWEGRQYAIGMGYVERWPQGWPDMPQWGFSSVVAVDAIGAMAACTMLSCVQGEILVDNPYAYFPCNEQYSTSINGATSSLPFFFGSPYYVPADANGLIAINYARGNNRSAVYADGIGNLQVNTGLSLSLLGDQNTGMGTNAYGAQGQNTRAPGLVYTDAGLPIWSNGNGVSAEFWFNYSAGFENCSLFTLFAMPTSWANAGNTNGAILNVSVPSNSGTATAGTQMIVATGAGIQTYPFTVSTNPQHFALTIAAGTTGAQVNMVTYLNGVVQGTQPIIVPNGMRAFGLGPTRYSFDGAANTVGNYSAFNYAAGHVAYYSYQLSSARIQNHYQSGATGWANVTAPYRFSQILSWGGMGLKRGGVAWQGSYTQENTKISEAYSLSGSSVIDALNQVTKSEGGRVFSTGNGSVVYLQRWAVYNQSPSITFGDNATAANGPINANPAFINGLLTNWSGTGCTVAASTVQTYMNPWSMLMTPIAGATSCYARGAAVSIIPGDLYNADAWVYSSTGYGSVTIGFDWISSAGATVSSSFGTANVPAGSWFNISSIGSAPSGGVAGASLRIGELSSPGTANTLFIQQAMMTLTSPEIPYLPDATFDYDNTTLYNEVISTQIRGPNSLLTVDIRDRTSQQQYFRRSALQLSSQVMSDYDVYDAVTWSLARYKQPSLRLAEMTIDASANPYVAFPTVLATDISDVVVVNRRPLGGAVITELGIVEHVKHEIGPIHWKTTYQISPYNPNNTVLMTDTNGQNVLGSQTLPW